MTDQQRIALKDSIEHWKRMRDNPDCEEKPLADDCPCCRLWFNRGNDACSGCPIAEATGADVCEETPWAEACLAWKQRRLHLNNWRYRAGRMIDFMEGILKEGA
jgi:hypothetical protein